MYGPTPELGEVVRVEVVSYLEVASCMRGEKLDKVEGCCK